MARLRFPGRPGHRFDRISVKYFADDYSNISDPALAFLPQFQKGLKEFRELTGASDEENEFEGFTKEDVKKGERKLKEALEIEKQNQVARLRNELSPSSQEESLVFTRHGKARRSLDNLPASARTRNRIQKTVVQKSFTEICKSGITSPKNPHAVVKLKDVARIAPVGKSGRPKKFKLDAKHAQTVSQLSYTPSMKTEKDMAKFLLEKAKQANLIIQQKALKRKLSPGKKPIRKQFVLPTQSSRSSRVIKPNKRLLGDDTFNVEDIKKKVVNVEDIKKKVVNQEPNNQTKSSSLNTSVNSNSANVSVNSVSESPTLFSSKSFSDKSPGIFDQPLIRAGKRDRKPSLKLRLESDANIYSQNSKFEGNLDSGKSPRSKSLGMTSPLAAPKLGTGLFTSPGTQTQFQKVSENQKLGMLGLGASRKPGASIVQKAKLQLNRAALNKSKAALARSLKAEMKREAKIAEQAKNQDLKSPGKSPVSETVIEVAKPKKRRRKCCVACSQKSDVFLYQNVFVCTPCKLFYLKSRLKARNNKQAIYECKEKGKCKLKPETRGKCRYCRLKSCIEAGLPNAALVKSLLQEPSVKPEPETQSSPEEKKPQKTDATILPLPTVVQMEKSPAVKMVTAGCNTNMSPKRDGTEEELSPLRLLEGSEKKHKKRRAFKELLKTKQEKSEPTVSVTEEPTTLTPGLLSPKQGSVEDSPSPGAAGPRIKHVCRNAAVVLGKPLATFPEKSELRLSALPTKDKVQLWKKDEENRAAVQESDDDRPMDEIIQKSPESVVIVKKSPAVKPQPKKLTGVAGLRLYKRKMRCKKCAGCLAKDCGECRHCLDKPKFGGPDTIRQACIKRKCSNPSIRRNATPGFINPKDSGTDSNAESLNSSPEKIRMRSIVVQKPELDSDNESIVPGAESSPVKMTGLESQTGTLVDDQAQARTVGDNNQGPSSNQVIVRARAPEVRVLDFDSMPNVQLERISSRRRPGKISSKLMKKQEFQQKFAKAPGNNDSQCYPVSLQHVLPASRQWGGLQGQPPYHPIKVDFKTACDINSVWTYGLALTMSAAMSVRTLCFLCGSAGKHELIYCSICCEPFHEFCLEDYERPTPDHYDDWCCSKCQYCHVCGRQNHLLQCDRCQNTYHPGCLGPNYPTKPSKKKNIWVCTKCVKCKSCGATTPGSSSDATWTYDFSLCYECGQLMDKGNFCPICHKCYSDDDWESKMIQCNMCESWVHSRCEGLTDEMYEILSYLPEDLSFYCRNCHPHGCPEWESTLKRELQQGLENILHTLILTKSAQFLLKHEKKKSPEKISPHSKSDITESVSHLHPQILSRLNQDSTKCHSSKDTGVTSGNVVHVPDKTDIKAEKTQLGESFERKTEDSGNCETASKDKTQETVNKGCDQSTNVSCDLTVEKRKDLSKEVDRDMDVETKDSLEQVCDIENKEKSDPMEIGDCDGSETKSICDKSLNVCDSHRTSVLPETSKKDEVCIRNDDKNGKDERTLKDTDEQIGSAVTTCSSVKRPGKMLKCDFTVIHPPKIEHSSETKQTKLVVIQPNQAEQQSQSENKRVVEFKTDGSEESSTVSSVNEKAVVASKKILSVHFKIDNREKTPERENPEDDQPHDLMTMAEKMKDGCYKSVALFCEDILRIIQNYLDNDAETRTSRKKAVISARSVFVKQMEKIFPWFKVKMCRHWFSNRNMPYGMMPDATLPPSTDHTYAQWLKRSAPPMSPQPSPFKRRAATPMKKLMPLVDEDEGEAQTFFEGEDMRKCMFCLQYGDQDPDYAGRLLYCGQDDWCHINCALWSAEVYEDADGSLQNMAEAYSRGKMLKCDLCQRNGATVGCNTRGCKSNYHFMCARQARCRLQEDKKIFCREHTGHVDGEILGKDKFKVLRRVFIETNRVRNVKKSWVKGLAMESIRILYGSCCIENLGRLTDLSDKRKFLEPVDFTSTRIYWSTKVARRRCVYTCRVIEVRPEQLKSPTIAIQDMRIVHDENNPDYVPLSTLDLSGIDLGVHHPAICEKSMDSVVDLTAVSQNTSETVSALDDCQILTSPDLSMNKTQDSKISTGEQKTACISRRASFSGTETREREFQPRSLSSSWPRQSQKRSSLGSQLDLSLLSPKTLKMLNIKDTQKYSSSPIGESSYKEDGDCSLLKIADRLNRAAAKSSKSEQQQSNLHSRRASSVDRASPSGLSRAMSPDVRKLRSQSVDTDDNLKSPAVSKPASPVEMNTSGQQLAQKLADLPERPFSPPYRMLSRSRSLSVDKELRLSNSISRHRIRKEGNGIMLPSFADSLDKESMVASLKKPVAISSSLTSPEPKPVDCSSPVANALNSVKSQERVLQSIDESESCGENLETTDASNICMNSESSEISLDSCSIGTEAGEVLNEIADVDSSAGVNVCLTDETGESQETIIVMTDSGESLTEEEAIRIVQEVIESRCSSEDETQVSLTTEDQDCSVQNDQDERNVMESDDGQAVIVPQDGDSQSGTDVECLPVNDEACERSDSPFVPKIDGSSLVGRTSCLKRNVTLNRSGNSNVNDLDKNEFNSEMDIQKYPTKEMKDNETNEADQAYNNLSEIVDLTDSGNNEGNVLGTDLDIQTDTADLASLITNENETKELAETAEVKLKGNNDQVEDIPIDIDDDSDLELLYEIDNSAESEGDLDKEESGTCEVERIPEGDKCCEKTPSESVDMLKADGKRNECLDDRTDLKNEEIGTESASERAVESEVIEGSSTQIEVNEDTATADDGIKVLGDKKDEYINDRNDSDEIDGGETKQVLNTKELKEELKQIFSATGLESHYEDSDMLLNCISVVEEKKSSPNSVKYLGIDVDRKSPEIQEKKIKIFTENLGGSGNSPEKEKPTDINEEESNEHMNDSVLIEPLDCGKVDDKKDSSKKVAGKTQEEMNNEDERQSSEKHEVLRGLGLGTCDEVEKIKNSPPKNPARFQSIQDQKLDRKRRYLQKSPLKIYPLRKSIVSPVRKDDTEHFTNDAEKADDSKLKPGDSNNESSSKLPVLDPISKKIKEESIAKSCPEEKGPFKCQTCRRLYRTETSYKAHVENCNFYVSSSEEEETNDSDNEFAINIAKCRKQVKMMRNRKKMLRMNKIKESLTNKTEKESNDICSLKASESKVGKAVKASLRTSTMNQRVAIEVEKRMKEEILKGGSPKQRGRPSLKRSLNKEDSNAVNTPPCRDAVDQTVGESSMEKRGRGRPRKLSVGSPEIPQILSNRELRRKSREIHILKTEKDSYDSEDDTVGSPKVKKGRGRPRKEVSDEKENITESDCDATPKTEKSKTGKQERGRLKKSFSGKNEKEPSESESETKDSAGNSHKAKRGRGRPRRSVSQESLNEISEPESPVESTHSMKRGRVRPKLDLAEGTSHKGKQDKTVSLGKRKTEVGENKTAVLTKKRCTGLKDRETGSKMSAYDSDFQSPSSSIKKKRGRPRKVKLTDSEESLNGEEDEIYQTDMVEEMEHSDKDSEQSDESIGPVLDPETGLFFDKSSGKVLSPTGIDRTDSFNYHGMLQSEPRKTNVDGPEESLVDNLDMAYNDKGKNMLTDETTNDSSRINLSNIGIGTYSKDETGITQNQVYEDEVSHIGKKTSDCELGNHNLGNHIPGNHNLGNHNPGNHNTVNHNPDNHNLGNHNPGNHNLGNHNPGNHNTVNHNPGNHNLGNHNHNPGNPNPGNHNTVNHNPGNHNLGNHNPGNHNPGNHNPGNQNLGNHNPGNHNQGNHNPGNHNRGNHDPGNHSSEIQNLVNHNPANHYAENHKTPKHNPGHQNSVSSQCHNTQNNPTVMDSSARSTESYSEISSASAVNTQSETQLENDLSKLGAGVSAEDMPKQVLKLLKDGHKVVIKNPKQNKSYIWQKTENGYIGKLIDPNTLNVQQTPDTSEQSQQMCANDVGTVSKKAAAALDRQDRITEKDAPKLKECKTVSSVKEVKHVYATELLSGNSGGKLKSASEILANRKKALAQKIQARKALNETESSMERGATNTTVLPANKHISPTGCRQLRAEYVGGLVIGRNKDSVVAQVHQKINSTASVASSIVRQTLLTQRPSTPQTVVMNQPQTATYNMQSLSLASGSPIVSLNVIPSISTNIATVPVNSVQPMVTSVVPGLVTGNIPQLAQPLVQYNRPQLIVQPRLQPTLESAPFPQFAQTGLHTLTGAQTVLGYNLQSFPNQAPILQQQPQQQTVLDSPQLTASLIPQVVKVSRMNSCPNIITHPQVVRNTIQPLTTGVCQQSFLSQPVQLTSSASILTPAIQTVGPSQTKQSRPAIITTSSTITSPSIPIHVNNCLDKPNSSKYEKMKKFLLQRALLPVSKTVTTIDKDRMVLGRKRGRGRPKNKSVLGSPERVKTGIRKGKKMWKSLREHKEAIASPHSTDKASHPIIHPQKEVTSLPVAAVELEIQDIPLSDMAEIENSSSGADKQNLGHLEYEITSDDGFSCRSDSLDGAWKQVTEKVQDARAASRLKQLSFSGLSSQQMLGFSHPSVMYHVEQLFGANYCRKYKFKYHKHELAEQELELVNPSGSIRTEPYAGRNPWDMFSFLLSRYRMMPQPHEGGGQDEEMSLKSSRRATSMDLPMAMRFRKLKEHSKEAVGVYRSLIHGRGLFCKRNIDGGEMIIEYSGELIRNSMTDIREKYYESKGIGCYMFRIDDVDVVDATMKGSAARFINHSCEPNCYSKVITVDNRKHIVIFAMRPISRGEELTYDYKFPIEEVKIPCTCGSKKCRKYLN